MDCWNLSKQPPVSGNRSVAEIFDDDSCFINGTASSVVWAFYASLWFFTLIFSLLALRVVERNKPLQLQIEQRVLMLIGATSLWLCLLGFVKCPSPWTNPIGQDALVSVFFALGTWGLLVFIAISPLNPAGSGIALFAIQRQRTLYKVYRILCPINIAFATITSALPLFMLIDPLALRTVFTPLMAGLFGFVIACGALTQLYSVYFVRRDFIRALKEKRQEVKEHQKRGIERIVKSTFRLDLAMVTCLAFVLSVCILITASVHEVLLVCWALFPAVHTCGWIFMTRYALVSRETSLKINNRRSRASLGKWQIVATKTPRHNSIPTFSTSTSVNMLQQQQQGNGDERMALSSSPTLPQAGGTRQQRKNYRINVPTKRWLTRVEEVENEGTIISKFDHYLSVASTANPGAVGAGTKKPSSEDS